MRLVRVRATNITAAAVIVGLIAAATTCAYFLMFGQFAAYDDEGYILQSVRSYLDGGRLFDDVFTQYGPAFYLLESAIHTVLGAPLTHDFERFLTIGIWVTSGAGCAAITWRLSQSLMAAAWTFVAVMVQLRPIANEPAHPQGLLVLIVTTVVLLSARSGESGPTKRRLAAMGALTAVALLSKVNVGTFLALGVALPLILTSRLPRSAWTAAALCGLGVVACALPLVVMRSDAVGWAMHYALTVSLSLAMVLIAVYAGARHDRRLAGLMVYAGAIAVAASLLLLPSLSRGTSLSALWNGVIVRPSQLADVFQLPIHLPRAGLIATFASAALALTYFALRQKGATLTPMVVAAAKLGAASIGLYALQYGSRSPVLAYLTPWLWISIPTTRVGPDPGAFGRHVLATTAVLQVLQAYPVAGSQRAFATFLMVPVVFTLTHDAITALLSHEFGRPRFARAVAPTFVLLAGVWVYHPFLDVAAWRRSYERNYALRLPGAEHLRLPAREVARFQWLSANVAERCDTLLTLPGLFSLNAWSNVEPPGPINVGAWTTLLSATEQAAIWRQVDASPRPCAVYSPAVAGTWRWGDVSERSAANKLQARFVRHSGFDGYEFFVRPDQRAPQSPVRLFLGRQTFEPEATPLPVVAAFLRQPESSIRLWFRTRSSGVLLGCQSQEHVQMTSRRWLPMVYVGRTGRLHGQHWTPAFEVQATSSPVNDGAWHHAVLVNDSDGQRFFVDGELAGALTSTISSGDGLASCQVGAGNTNDWRDAAPDSDFQGEVENLAVAGRAWSAADVVADRASTFPGDEPLSLTRQAGLSSRATGVSR